MLENASDNPQPPIVHPEPKVDPEAVDTLLSTFAVAVGDLLMYYSDHAILTVPSGHADFRACRPH